MKATKLALVSIFFLLAFMPLICAKDIAYVVNAVPESQVENVFGELNYSYDVITDSQISSTNFSTYRMVLVGDDTFTTASITKLKDAIVQQNSLILNSRYYYKTGTNTQWGWSSGVSSVTSPSSLKNNENSNTAIITAGVPLNFNGYSISNINLKSSILAGQKPTGTIVVTYKNGGTIADAVVAFVNPGTQMLNGKVTKGRSLFFGVTKPQYWTPETRLLFKNAVSWAIKGQDKDGDGFFDDTDCNDNNAAINPNATEIAYNGIDENCDGKDLADVDNDGYCKLGYVIQNKLLQCNKETGSTGKDCNDNDLSINPGALDLTKNCINDAPILASQIPSQTWNEDESKIMDLKNGYFSDPEGDVLSYSFVSASDSNIVVTNLGNGVFNLSSKSNWFGNGAIILRASDGNKSIDVSVNVIVVSVNDAPIIIKPIESQIWNEDESKIMDVKSGYFFDIEGSSLVYSFVSASSSNIVIQNLGGGIFNLTSIGNWNGDGSFILRVSDGDKSIDTNVNVEVSGMNDAPILVSQIPTQSTNEDVPKIIDLSGYFADLDGDSLTYSVVSASNSNIVVNSLSNGRFNISGAENWNGAGSFVIRASDGDKSIDANVNVVVLPVNDAPIIDNIVDKDYFAGQLVKIIPSAIDPEGNNVVFAFAYPLNASGEWQTNIGNEGSYTITVTASDGVGGISSKSFVLTVMPRAIINEISSGTNDWIELYNPQDIEINLAQCYFENNANNKLDLSGIVEGKSFRAFDWSAGLNENGDSVKLICDGGVLDEVVYGNSLGNAPIAVAGQSIGRIPDGKDTNNDSADFKIFEVPTKNLSNNADMVIPNVYLISPSNGAVLNERNVNFQVNASDNSNLLNCEVYGDFFGGRFIVVKQLIISLINGNGIGNFSIQGLADGTYTWNVKCTDNTNSVFGENRTFSVNAPDAPVLGVIGSKSVLENQTLQFNIIATDQDNNILRYYAEGLPAGAIFFNNTFSWRPIFNQSGAYNVVFFVEDSAGLKDSETVKITVGDVKQPPVFSDALQCVNKSSKIAIEIKSPDKGDEFNIGEQIEASAKVKNNLNETLSGYLRIYLYDGAEEKAVAEEKVKIKLEKGDSETNDFVLEIPDDAEEGEDFVVYVVVDNDYCNSVYNEISIAREDDRILVDRFTISPAEIYSGNTVDFAVKIKNVGNDDQEDVQIKLSNPELGINLQSEKFDLEGYDGDDSVTKYFKFTMPENTTAKSYEIKATVNYGDVATASQNLIVSEKEIGNVNEETLDQAYQSNTETYTGATTSQTTTGTYTGATYTLTNRGESTTYAGEDAENALRIYSESRSAKTASSIKDYVKLPSYMQDPKIKIMLTVLNILFIVGILIIMIKIFMFATRRWR